MIDSDDGFFSLLSSDLEVDNYVKNYLQRSYFKYVYLVF